MTANEKDAAAAGARSKPGPEGFGFELVIRLVCVAVGVFLVAIASALLTSFCGLIDQPQSVLLKCSLVGAVGGVLVLVPQCWKGISRDGGPVTPSAFVWLTVCGASVTALLVLATSGVTRQLEIRQKNAWNLERTRFENSDEGFAVLHRVAKEQFGVELLLGTDEDVYQVTTHQPPGSLGSSPGVMAVFPGYCELGLSPEGIAFEFPVVAADRAVPDPRTVLGVAFHELGHCIDESRDQASFKDQHVGTSSISPLDRAEVKDIQTFVAAERKSETMLWREIYADLFAVGYAGLEWKGAAPVFVRTLLNERVAKAAADPTHATACWIQAALKSAPPESLATLSQWADAHRAAAPCKMVVSAAPAKG